MITNVVIFIAFAVYCLYTTILKKIKYMKSYKDLLFIGKVNSYHSIPIATIFRISLSAVLVIFMFKIFSDNRAFLIAIILTWVIATAFQLADIVRDQKKIYLYRERVVVGDKEYKSKYSMKKQKDGEKHYKIGFEDKVFDINIIDIINATQEVKDKVNT